MLISERYTYLFLVLFCFCFPFLYLLIHKVVRDKEKLALISPTVLIAGIPFIIWDVLAVAFNHWQFNPKLTTQINLLNLPIEEWMFLLLIPQSCLLLWVLIKRCNSLKDMQNIIFHHKNILKK